MKIIASLSCPQKQDNDSWEGFGRIQLLQSNLPTTPLPHQLQRKSFEQCKMMHLVVLRKQPLLHSDWLQASTTTFTYVISFYISNILDTAYYMDDISRVEKKHMAPQKGLNWPGYHHIIPNCNNTSHSTILSMSRDGQLSPARANYGQSRGFTVSAKTGFCQFGKTHFCEEWEYFSKNTPRPWKMFSGNLFS